MAREHRIVKTPVLSTDAPVVAGPPQGQWTYDAWETLPDDGNRYEIIGGVVYMSTAPSAFHQWIVLALVEHLGIPAKRLGLGFPFTAPIGVLMPGCDPVQPDFVLVLAGRAAIIHDRRIFGVPDLIVEILSPGNRAYDLHVKLAAYARAGLPEYAVVDPSTRSLSHYRLVAPGQYAPPLDFGESATVSFDCVPTIAVPVRELFAGAPDTTL